MNIFQPLIHYGGHLIAPFAIAWLLWRDRWKQAGLIILAAILIPTLLFAKLQNIYVITMIIATIWLGLIGFLDDYIKVFKKNKEGLKGTSKIIGQIGVGLIVGGILYFSNDVVVHKRVTSDYKLQADETFVTHEHAQNTGENYKWIRTDDMTTTIPFFKGNEFNYNWLLGENGSSPYGWLIFIPIVIFIVTAVSNGANMTDGLDGLATGTSAIIGIALAVLAYVSSHVKFADYLNVMYIPHAEEMVIFISAFVGACIGFLWYNSYPAQVFMGDVGSGALGFALGCLLAVAIWRSLEARPALSSALLLALPVSAFLVDATLTLAGRILRGERWWTPHVQHAYQATARQVGHGRVTMGYLGWTLLACVIAVLARSQSDFFVAALVAIWFTLGAVLWRRLRRWAQVRESAVGSRNSA